MNDRINTGVPREITLQSHGVTLERPGIHLASRQTAPEKYSLVLGQLRTGQLASSEIVNRLILMTKPQGQEPTPFEIETSPNGNSFRLYVPEKGAFHINPIMWRAEIEHSSGRKLTATFEHPLTKLYVLEKKGLLTMGFPYQGPIAIAGLEDGLFDLWREDHFSNNPILGNELIKGRYRDVLIARAAGYTVEETAAKLELAVGTIRSYITDALNSLSARNKLCGVMRGLRSGLFALEDIFPKDTYIVPSPQLPPREQEVLTLLASEYTRKEIASQLEISLHTVNVHIKKIYSNLGVSNQLDAVMLGLRAKLFTVEGIYGQNKHQEPHEGSFPLPDSREKLPPKNASLSDRQREVLITLASGLSTWEAAKKLDLSEATIRDHTQDALLNLDAHTQLEAVMYALRDGLFTLEDVFPKSNQTEDTLGPWLLNRQREVLIALASGLSTEETADKLKITAQTVRTHLRDAFMTLGAHTKLEAVMFALREKIFTIEDVFPKNSPSKEVLVPQFAPKQLDILISLASGLSINETAAKLNTTPEILNNHIQHIQSKLDAPNPLTAITFGLRDGLFTLDDIPENTKLDSAAQLIPRQRDILISLASGLSINETAAKLSITTKVVLGNLRYARIELGTNNYLETTLLALRSGIFTLEDVFRKISPPEDAPENTAKEIPHLLSSDQHQVLTAIASGYSTQEAATKLGMSINTIQAHMFNTLEDLQARTPFHAAMIALKQGKLDLENVFPENTNIKAPNQLKPREREVLLSLTSGDTTEQIADKLEITRITVNDHGFNALEKLGAHSRAHGVILAIRRGIFTLEDVFNRLSQPKKIPQQLKPRQREVLIALASGLSTEETSDKLKLSNETVHWHMTNALEQLGAHSREQAIVLALKQKEFTLKDIPIDNNKIKISNPLIPKEVEILVNLASGLLVREVVVKLNLSKDIIDAYIKSAIKKLGATNRAHAGMIAIRRGIFTLEDVFKETTYEKSA